MTTKKRSSDTASRPDAPQGIERFGSRIGIERIQFVRHRAEPHRRHYVNEGDVRVVLGRLPPELWRRVRRVHFTDRARGNRVLGYTTTRGRREISLCALPTRVSLSRFPGAVPPTFGAVRGGQWPTRAVRRYLLYDVLLHELGHLQTIDVAAREPRRKFADERAAQRFAEAWRARLWAEHFDHPDPVHNCPSPDEMERVERGWLRGHAQYKLGLRAEKTRRRSAAARHYRDALEQYPEHAHAFLAMAKLVWVGRADEEADEARAAALLRRAAQLDPGLPDIHLYLAVVTASAGHAVEAREAYAAAVRAEPDGVLALTHLASFLDESGEHNEAEKLFQRLLRRSEPPSFLALRDYAALLLFREDVADPSQEVVARAIELLNDALKILPHDFRAHYNMAVACRRHGQIERALRHARTAARVRPENGGINDLIAEIEAEAASKTTPQ